MMKHCPQLPRTAVMVVYVHSATTQRTRKATGNTKCRGTNTSCDMLRSSVSSTGGTKKAAAMTTASPRNLRRSV